MPSILIVEDDEDTRETLAELLRGEGYQVAGAGNGQEALERLSQRGPAPCMILLDLMMPVMDGWEFRRRQQQDPRLARIPVVVLSGADKEVTRDIAREAAGCFNKPLDFDALLVTLARHCS